jgi:hypothetical protein
LQPQLGIAPPQGHIGGRRDVLVRPHVGKSRLIEREFNGDVADVENRERRQIEDRRPGKRLRNRGRGRPRRGRKGSTAGRRSRRGFTRNAGSRQNTPVLAPVVSGGVRVATGKQILD